MTSPIRTVKLSKTYEVRARKGLFKSEKRSVEALKGVSLEVNQGEIFGLLGPNGAGKTTLIKILSTLLLPTSGEAWINGYNVTKDENKVRASVGCMLMGERGLYWKLTGRENIEFVITTLFGLLMPPIGYLLYRLAENYARKQGSLSTY
jgi:ABC-2 type transport system ATP-binding protein